MVSTHRASRRLPPFVLGAAVLVLCALVALAARSGLHGSVLNPRAAETGTATALRTTPLERLHGGRSGTALSLPHRIGWAALGLLAAFLLAVIVRRLSSLRTWRRVRGKAGAEDGEAAEFRHSPAVDAEEESVRQQALRDAVMRSLDEIRRDPDARRAIIGAYRLMEAALARTGLPRAPAEAPREYLARALGAIDVGPDAPRRLTVLFERARFGDTTLELSLRDQAVEALLELQSAL